MTKPVLDIDIAALQARDVEVDGSHEDKPDTTLDKVPSEVGGDGFTITRPGKENADPLWNDRELLYTQHAEDQERGARSWTQYVETSVDDPVRFRAAIEHYHEGRHEPHLYTLEYNDQGYFNQNDPELAEKMPAAVYQSMLGLTVALRDVKYRTLQAIETGKITHAEAEAIAAGKPAVDDTIADDEWTQEETIYDIAIVKHGNQKSVWEMGLEQTQTSPLQFRAFAYNPTTQQRVWMAVNDVGEFLASDAKLSSALPEAVYSGLYGLASGAQVAKKRTVVAALEGRVFAGNPGYGQSVAALEVSASFVDMVRGDQAAAARAYGWQR